MRVGDSHRNVGVDVARAVALFGIMVVHIFPAVRTDGSPHAVFVIDHGRTPALFPVLAGVGLALAYGGRIPPVGRALWEARARIVPRALLLVVVGLLLGRVDSPPLVILVHFGLMFLAAIPFLGLSARRLWPIAVAWVVLVPLLSYAIRTGPAGVEGSPQLPGALAPLQVLVDLFLSSSYPVLNWTGYVLIGLAVGRTGLDGPRAAVRMLVAGAAVAASTFGLSYALLAAAGGPDALADNTEGFVVIARGMDAQLEVGLPGTTPTTDWRWLLVAAQHSGTTFDLAHTGAAAVAILGAALLLAQRVPRSLLIPLAAAGSMTFTLYTLHVLSLWRDGPLLLDDPRVLYLAQVAVALVLATLWRTQVGRGPLEALSAWLDRLTGRLLPRREAPTTVSA